MSEENFEAAQPPDDGGQQASREHAQFDKDSTIEHDHSDANTDSGGTQGGGDTLTHEVGHWLGDEEPGVEDLTAEPPAPPEPAPAGTQQGGGDTLTHEVGHWLGDQEPGIDNLTTQTSQPTHAQHELGHTLGFRHEHTSPSSSDADKPRPRYFDGRFLAVIAIIGLIIIGALIIFLNNTSTAAGALKTLGSAQTLFNTMPDDSSDSGFFWFFDAGNIDVVESCVDDYAALLVPICVRNSTDAPIPVGGSSLSPGEEHCQPVPVIRTRENEPAPIAEIEGVDIDSVIVGTVGTPSMDTDMMLGVKTLDDHDYSTETVELLIIVVPDPQADGYDTPDLFVADSFVLPPPEPATIEPKIRLFLEPHPPEPGGTNPGFFDIMATIDIEPNRDRSLALVSFPDPDDDPTGTLAVLMAFAYESDLLAQLPPLCEPVSLPPPDVTEEPTDEPPDSSVPVSTEEPTEEPVELPPAVCGDLVCNPATENSDICPNDCQCVDDGICAPGEGDNCQDCGSSAGSCQAVCGDSSQCAEGLSCSGGICWDACLCGGDCGAPDDGDGGGCTGPLVCGDGFCNESCNEIATCTVDCITP